MDRQLKLSIVELSPVPVTGDRHQAILNSVEMAQKAEQWGFTRIWVAEHHGAQAMAGRAPEVLIPLIASKTNTIRVGSGSVLLNHYSPYKVAENFSTLEDMFPERIDMGIGRATTGVYTDIALQRNRSFRQTSEDSAEQLSELVAWMNDGFDEEHPFSRVTVAKNGSVPPFWLLGSSAWSASAAAQLGLRYAFAGFINPNQAYHISRTYINNFVPSAKNTGVTAPEMILSLSLYCAPTMEEAARMTAPAHVMMHKLRTGDISGRLYTEEESIDFLGGIPEIEWMEDPKSFPRVMAGTPDLLYDWVQQIAATFGISEVMIQCITPNHEARLRSHRLLAERFGILKSTDHP